MAGLTVTHPINPIFQYIFDCLGFNSMNNIFNLVFQGLNCLWMVSVTLILNGSPQKIVQRGQITALWRPIDIRISVTVIAAPCSFLKKNDLMTPPDQNPHQKVTRCGCISFSMIMFVFSEPQMQHFCLLTFCPSNRKYTEKLG